MRVVDLVELFESALRFGAKAKLTSVCCALNVEAGLKPGTAGDGDGGSNERCSGKLLCYHPRHISLDIVQNFAFWL